MIGATVAELMCAALLVLSLGGYVAKAQPACKLPRDFEACLAKGDATARAMTLTLISMRQRKSELHDQKNCEAIANDGEQLAAFVRVDGVDAKYATSIVGECAVCLCARLFRQRYQ